MNNTENMFQITESNDTMEKAASLWGGLFESLALMAIDAREFLQDNSSFQCLFDLQEAKDQAGVRRILDAITDEQQNRLNSPLLDLLFKWRVTSDALPLEAAESNIDRLEFLLDRKIGDPMKIMQQALHLQIQEAVEMLLKRNISPVPVKRNICWSPTLRLACSASWSFMATSKNGFDWRYDRPFQKGHWASVCWSSELGLFCAVSEDAVIDEHFVSTSSDGFSWTLQCSPSAAWKHVCWSSDLRLFCALACKPARLMTSPDGISWTLRTIPDFKWKGLCWSPKARIFCAVTNFAAMTSSDGIRWTHTPVYIAHGDITRIDWDETHGFIVCTFCQQSLNQFACAISEDGIHWTPRKHEELFPIHA